MKVTNSTESKKLLVERVASSPHLNRSARLRDMLIYVSSRVLEDDAGEIHEQEVGHKVFGRAANYDTSSDNIVRVHASMLRKRLGHYFSSDGLDEPMILEIPKGNYAPIFRERSLPEALELSLPPGDPPAQLKSFDWRFRAAIACAMLFATSTAVLWFRGPKRVVATSTVSGPTLHLFWSQVFPPDRATDVVLDDAALGLYQELSGRGITLSEYLDRSYLRNLTKAESAVVLHRHSSASSTSLVWKILQIPGVDSARANLRFARDYSFRELKSDNAILLGNARFNPWIESFLPKLGIRWMFDPSKSSYYPVDTWDGFSPRQDAEGYVSVALLPNLDGNGRVLVLSGTGGSALGAGTDFLSNDGNLAELRRHLPASSGGAFPYFEALISVRGHGAPSREPNIVLCRVPH